MAGLSACWANTGNATANAAIAKIVFFIVISLLEICWRAAIQASERPVSILGWPEPFIADMNANRASAGIDLDPVFFMIIAR